MSVVYLEKFATSCFNVAGIIEKYAKTAYV